MDMPAKFYSHAYPFGGPLHRIEWIVQIMHGKKVVTLTSDPARILDAKDEIAEMLIDFRPNSNSWDDLREAEEEVIDSIRHDKKRISIVALDDTGPVGWIAAWSFTRKLLRYIPWLSVTVSSSKE